MKEITINTPREEFALELEQMIAHAYRCCDVDQRAALAGLRQLDRDSFLLCNVYGYSEQEVAVLLRVAQQTVSRANGAAKKKIKGGA